MTAVRDELRLNFRGRDGVPAANVAKKDLRPVGRGGAAVVYAYSAHNGPAIAVKIFHKPDSANWPKIERLIARAGADAALMPGKEDHGIAWPASVVTENGKRVGITLPYFDKREWRPLDHWVESNLAKNITDGNKSLGMRLTILRNCAAALAGLHAKKAYVVDLKPSNILVHEASGKIRLIDCDSYRVEDEDRIFPASHISAGYILPSAFGPTINIRSLGEEQDDYAFAVIAFRMLNFGIHPFQGILHSSEEISTDDEKAARYLYAYGEQPSSAITPLPQSVHRCWPLPLREMFAQSFSSQQTGIRANVWQSYFASVIDRKQILSCDKFPNDVSHIRFENCPCPQCARQAAVEKIKISLPPPKPGPGLKMRGSGVGVSQSNAGHTQAPHIPVPPPLPTGNHVAWVVVGCLVAALAFAIGGKQLLSGGHTPNFRGHTPNYYVVNTPMLFVREGPGENYNRVRKCIRGTTVDVLNFVDNDWVEVTVAFDNGTELRGYMGVHSLKPYDATAVAAKGWCGPP